MFAFAFDSWSVTWLLALSLSLNIYLHRAIALRDCDVWCLSDITGDTMQCAATLPQITLDFFSCFMLMLVACRYIDYFLFHFFSLICVCIIETHENIEFMTSMCHFNDSMCFWVFCVKKWDRVFFSYKWIWCRIL